MAVIDDRRRRRGDFSPAALDGLLLAMTADPGYVFQDSAGMTAAVAHGDPVGLTPHRFGGSLDPSQSTDAERPTLDIALGNGRGPEQVTNGDFSGGANDWTLGTGWGVSGGAASLDGTQGANSSLTQTIPGVASTTYEIKISVSGRSGGATAFIFWGNAQVGSLNSDGDYTFTYEWVAGTSNFSITGNAGVEISVDNISVREVLRYGPRGIRFNGTDQLLDATGLTAATGPKTVIAGCITDDGETVANQRILSVQTGPAAYAASKDVAGQAGIFDGAWSGSADYDSESLSVLTFKHYATDGGIRVDGVSILDEAQTEVAFGGAASVGADDAGTGGFFDGVIHALLVFDRALSDKEIQLCEAWVAARQGRIL